MRNQPTVLHSKERSLSIPSALSTNAITAAPVRRARAAKAHRDEGVIDAQKVGDTWVAYGWERPGR